MQRLKPLHFFFDNHFNRFRYALAHDVETGAKLVRDDLGGVFMETQFLAQPLVLLHHHHAVLLFGHCTLP